jgi:hypothetical protein
MCWDKSGKRGAVETVDIIDAKDIISERNRGI